VQFSVVRKKKMSRERNVLIGLLTVVCLLQLDVIADVIVTPCPTKCKCNKTDALPGIGVVIDCHNERGIDPQQLYKQIDSLLISYANDSLYALFIQQSPLSHVPRSLCRLTTLTYLQLWWNRLVELPNNCFMDFHRLMTLHANNNDITKLPNGVFDGINQLTYLNLNNNKIADLPDGVFDGMVQITELDLSFNQIAELPNSIFSNMSNLTSLYLHGNNIAALLNGVFDGMGQLRYLDLSGNKITKLSNGVFDGMGKLNTLDLSDNKIINLSSGVFYGMGQLNILDLGFNKITDLWNAAFDGIGKLTHLYLGYNKIANISNGIFDGMGQLYKLDLSGNNITDVSNRVFGGMGKLSYLYVSGNKITDLSNGVFDGMNQLDTLDLSDNEVTKLSNRVFDGMSQLTILDVSNNKIMEISKGVFDNMGKLTHLNLRSNQISVLPSGVFHGMGQLTDLDLSSNKITDIANGVFDGVSQLNILDLSLNEIASIDRYVFSSTSNTSIRLLWLNNNQLTSLEPWWHNVNITAKYMNIGKNPWDCSCDNKFMTRWLNSIAYRIDVSDCVQCYTPPRLRNRIIIQMSDAEFCVDSAAEAAKRALTISMSSVAGVVIVLLSVGVIVYCLRVKLYTRFKFHPFDRDECLGEDMDYDVFLCCSSEDDEPEGSRILETVEAKGYRVCYHYRDFMPGLITANIEASVTRSKRTLCLLTSNFVRRFEKCLLVSLMVRLF